MEKDWKNNEHHFFKVEVPSIILDLDLDTYEIKLYLYIKRMIGEFDLFWESLATMEKETKISRRKIQGCMKKLASKFELHNKKLVTM